MQFQCANARPKTVDGRLSLEEVHYYCKRQKNHVLLTLFDVVISRKKVYLLSILSLSAQKQQQRSNGRSVSHSLGWEQNGRGGNRERHDEKSTENTL